MGAERHGLEPGRLPQFGQLLRGVFAIVAAIDTARGYKDAKGIGGLAVEHLPDTAMADHVGGGEQQMPAGFQNAVGLGKDEIGIKGQMFEDLHPRHQIKAVVGVRPGIAFGIGGLQPNVKGGVIACTGADGLGIGVGPFPKPVLVYPVKAVGHQRLKHKRRKDTHIQRAFDLQPLKAAQRGHKARPVGAQIAGQPLVDGRGVVPHQPRQFVKGIGRQHIRDAVEGQIRRRLWRGNGGSKRRHCLFLRRQLCLWLLGRLRGSGCRNGVCGCLCAPGQGFDHMIPGDVHGSIPRAPRLPQPFGKGCVTHHCLKRFAQCRRFGGGDKSFCPVSDEFKRPARVGHGDHRLARQHRLKRDVTVILVLRGKDHGARLGIVPQERLVIDRPQPCDLARHTQLQRQLVQLVLISGVFGGARDHQRDAGFGGGQPLEDQVQPFRRVDAPRRKKVVAIAPLPHGIGIGRRVVERLGFDAQMVLQPGRHIARIGIDGMGCVGKSRAVLGDDQLAQRLAIGVVQQVGIAQIPHVIGLPVLMDYPEKLVWMWGQIGGEFQPDDHIDRHAFHFAQIKHAGGQNVIGQHRAGIPFEGQRDFHRLVAMPVECADQIGRVPFGPARDKGNLRAKNADAHRVSLRWAASPAPQDPAGRTSGRPVRY